MIFIGVDKSWQKLPMPLVLNDNIFNRKKLNIIPGMYFMEYTTIGFKGTFGYYV